MLTADEIIAALHKGREVRPIQFHGVLWEDNDKACALSAIAIGLGIEPTDDINEEEEIYLSLGKILNNSKVDGVYEIFHLNDHAWGWKEEGGYGQVYDPDEAVIQFVKENY